MTNWTPDSWRSRPACQQPSYADPAHVERVCDRVRQLPPLVFSGEIESLREELAEAAAGRAFVLHGGDCAERFDDCTSPIIVRKLKILLQMSLVLTWGARRKLVRIGRLAGQYGKPRSKDTELVDGVEMGTFRGDNVNDLAATVDARTPDPERLLLAYFHSAATLNFVRALIDGGFADLHNIERWRLGFIGKSEHRDDYLDLVSRIRDALAYMETFGGVTGEALHRVPFYTSHEGLVLPYEQAHTRLPPNRDRYYNLGAHFLWIGERTRQLDGAHVEYFRGIANPLGVKIGPTCTPDDLRRLADTLDPDRVPARLTLITRFGQHRAGETLPGLVRALQGTGHQVVWSSDPMHGNTHVQGGRKTRDFDAILGELTTVFQVHEAEGSHLGGVHFELTGDDVTECVGGAHGLSAQDLGRAYQTGCDPRLNHTQSLEMAFAITHLMEKANGTRLTASDVAPR